MTTQAIEYSDTLRALGRFLDRVNASDIEVREEPDRWLTAWDQANGAQFTVFELEALRTVARLHRGLEGNVPVFNRSQMLRSLGRVLDQTGASRFHIKELTDGFQLSARIGGTRIGDVYSFDQVRAMVDDHLCAREVV